MQLKEMVIQMIYSKNSKRLTYGVIRLSQHNLEVLQKISVMLSDPW